MPERDVAVLIVHGILADDANFARPIISQLKKRLRDLQGRVHFKSVFWAHKLRDRQNNYLADIDRLTEHHKLRRLVVQGLGDAAAYQKTRKFGDSPYYEIQHEVDEKIREFDAERRKQDFGECPLVIIAHSLGSHIVSSYVWDVNKLKREPSAPMGPPTVARMWAELTAKDASAFRKLETFAAFVTIGSNIPLFTFAFGAEGTFPITMAPPAENGITYTSAFPGSAVPSDIAGKTKWVNFYSKRDILGYPLRPLNKLYGNDPYIKDICIKSEWGWLKGLPYYACYLAHVGYWTNKAVLEETVRLIRLCAGS